MTIVKARFDGRVFVPQEPVDLPVGFELEISISNGEESTVEVNPPPDAPSTADATTDRPGSALRALARLAKQQPCDLPEDFAAEHDHYLYGTPKKGR